MTMARRWLLQLLVVVLVVVDTAVADFFTDTLSAFVDVKGAESDFRTALDLAQKMRFDDSTSVNAEFDNRFPLSAMELGLLFQIYEKCATNESQALLTWCTGTSENGTSVGGQQLCPPGVRTHPCTGRVMDTDVVEYLWPWQGIKCDAFTDPTTVTNIYLSGEGLKCRLQDLDFSHMVSLEQLDLSRNELYGPFPTWLGNMTVLRFLNLRENQLQGKMPLSCGDNLAIEVIDLARNRFTAASLSFFKILKRVRYLDLSKNFFNLTLPTGFFSGDYIEYINLSYNAFHGPLPPLPSLKRLTALDLSHNAFEGQLPSEMPVWGWLDPNDPTDDPRLEVLDFSHNRFNGTIPPIGTLKGLRHFGVQFNQFDGVFPALPPSLIKPDTPQFFVGNDFLCPIPQLTPDPHDYGELTCRCKHAQPNTSDTVPWIPAASAQTECLACPRGSYSNTTTNGECTQCPMGHIPNISAYENGKDGATQCMACGPGTFSNVSGGTECFKCPLGSATNDTGQALCPKCFPGEYMDQQGERVCKVCREGMEAPQEGTVSCSLCRPGTYAAYKGEIACLPCPRGQYQSQKGMTACNQCPVGHIAPYPGHKECKPCRAGTFYDSTGRKCIKCAPDTFTDTDAQLQCKPCAEGQAADGFGNSKCEPLASEGFGRQPGREGEKECAPGHFNDGSFVGCQPCPLGTFAASARAATCTECGAGSFSDSTGATQCKQAPPGNYVGEEGADRFLRCPPEHYAEASGSAQCEPCPPDTTSLVGGSVLCTPLVDGEVIQRVEWPLVQLNLIGVNAAELLANTTLVEELRVLVKDVLSFQGISDFEVHVADVTASGPSTTVVKLAVEEFPPPREQPRSPKRDVFSKISDAYDDAQATVQDVKNKVDDAKDSATQWMDSVTGKSHDVKFRRDRHANISEVAPQENFRIALSRQLVNTPSAKLQVAASLLSVRLLSEPFASSKAMKCPKGFFFSKDEATGHRSCVACPPGSHGDEEGLIGACKLCPKTTFSDIEGLETCWDCPWGEGAPNGATACVECDYFTYECDDFWNDVLTAVVGVAAAGYKMWRRSRELWAGGRSGSPTRSEDVALVAAVRTFGRVPWATQRTVKPSERPVVDDGRV